MRREEARGDRLPEPLAADDRDALGDLSMALLVTLQRLTPVERAVFVLHEGLDLGHGEIGALVGRSEVACRKVLQRARERVAQGTRCRTTSAAEHDRLLHAFVAAATTGDVGALLAVLAPDAELTTDGGAAGVEIAGFRSLSAPRRGADGIARFVCAVTLRATTSVGFGVRTLNGRAALVLTHGGRSLAALQLAAWDGRIHRVWFQADPAKVRRLDPPT